MEKNNNIIEDFLIMMLIIVCSYQRIFLNISSFLDEILLILIFLFEIVKFIIKRKKINIKEIIPWAIFIVITMFNILLKKYEPRAYFEEIFNYLKIIILFETFRLANLDKQRYKRLMIFFVVINLISMLYGIFTFHFYKVIGYTVGDKFRNGVLRIRGLSGHPIALGFSSLLVLIFMYELKKENKKQKIISCIIGLISLYSLYLTQSRIVLAFAIGYFIFKILQKIVEKNNKKKNLFIAIIICLIIGISTITIISNINNIKNYLSDDIENTIRMYALQKSFEVFVKYPILGTGVGTFSDSASIKYNSYVYSEFNFYRFKDFLTEESGNVFESYLAKVIIETGIIGILFHIVFFKRYFKIAKRTNSTALYYLLICMCISMILNKAYQIPFVIGMAVIISNKNYMLLKEKKTEKKE